MHKIMYFITFFKQIYKKNSFYTKYLQYKFSKLVKVKFELNPLDNKKDIGLYVLFRTFSGHFMTIFRSNYFHLKNAFLIVFFFNIR